MSLDAAFYGFATLADAKAAWLEQLERVATTYVEAGVIIDALLGSPVPASEQVFATDAQSISQLWDLYHALEAGTTTSVRWQATDGTWYQLQPLAVSNFGQQAVACVIKYLIDCKANHRALAASISAAGTADAVIAIDLSSGWPARACTGGLTLHGGTFLGLGDTPDSYTGEGEKFVAVKADESGLEFVASAGGGGVQIDEFSAAGANTWTKPAGAKMLFIELLAAGCGGGAGRRGAAGTLRTGGTGGGGGAYFSLWIPASLVGATETVTVGTGGQGAPAITVDDTDGGIGGAGTESSFGDWAWAYIGGRGFGGSNGSVTGGTGGGWTNQGTQGAVSSSNIGETNPDPTDVLHPDTEDAIAFGGGGTVATGTYAGKGGDAVFGGGAGGGSQSAYAGWAGGSVFGGAGGGPGGSITSGDVVQTGGRGGASAYTSPTGPTGANGGSGGAAGSDGSTTSIGSMAGTGGGGGGSSKTAAAGNGGKGGRGCGGGGGGASLNGYTSGAGGDGGDGFVRVTTFT